MCLTVFIQMAVTQLIIVIYNVISVDTSPSCGGTLTNGSGLIESIDRDGDGRRDAYRDCLWTIIAPDNMTIEIQLVMVDFNPAGNDGFIEVTYFSCYRLEA